MHKIQPQMAFFKLLSLRKVSVANRNIHWLIRLAQTRINQNSSWSRSMSKIPTMKHSFQMKHQHSSLTLIGKLNSGLQISTLTILRLTSNLTGISLLGKYQDCFGKVRALNTTHHITCDPLVPSVTNPPRKIPFALKK